VANPGIHHAVAATPWGLGGALPAFRHPVLLLAGAGVGVCSSVIPYVTDQLAMARLPRASSMFAWQFAKAQCLAERHGWTRFASMQNHCNLIYREEEREMIPLCADQGVGVLPYSPLARGVLAGNRSRQGERRTVRAGNDPLSDERYHSPGDFDVVDRLAEVASARGAPLAQVALAWLLSHPAVTAPIVGATRLGHIGDALAAVQLTLTEEEVRRLEEPYLPHPVLGHS
jgi:1-deoxyxylulose-5-phosphate synthase